MAGKPENKTVDEKVKLTAAEKRNLSFPASVIAAWRALKANYGRPDWKQWEKKMAVIEATCQAEVAKGAMTEREAQLFRTTIMELIHHRRDVNSSCYMDGPGVLARPADGFWQRLEALRAVKAKGILDEQTARSALLELCCAVEAFRLFGDNPDERRKDVLFRTDGESRHAWEILRAGSTGGYRDYYWNKEWNENWPELIQKVKNGDFDEATRRVARWMLLLEGVNIPDTNP